MKKALAECDWRNVTGAMCDRHNAIGGIDVIYKNSVKIIEFL
jgi:hypothetical protein